MPPGPWEPPPLDSDDVMPPSDLGPLSISGTRLDFAMSTARVHTFQAKGLLGFLLGIAIVVGITVVIALIFTFALGVGVVLTAGTLVLAALGIGVARVQRRLPARRHRALGSSAER